MHPKADVLMNRRERLEALLKMETQEIERLEREREKTKTLLVHANDKNSVEVRLLQIAHEIMQRRAVVDRINRDLQEAGDD
jgi:hypothetical protein